MTDKEFAAQQSRVEQFFRKWKNPTGMDGWIVSHVWMRDGTCGKGYEDACARTGVAWEYLHATFYWNLQLFATHNDVELDRIVRHEICHVLVNEMRMWGPPPMSEREADDAMKHEERTVTCLANVLRWCRMAGQEDADAAKKKKK